MTTIRRLFPADRAQPIPCGACHQPFAGTSCPHCKEERPAFTLLKKVSAALPLVACRYYPGEACGCGQRGACLPAA